VSEAYPSRGRDPERGRVGSTIADTWTIDAAIGSGGMATVYAATHRDGHRVAIKILHASLSSADTRARFVREGHVANAVGHPGVVHVEGEGTTADGAAFLVLELLEGYTLEARRQNAGGALPVEEVLGIADQALAALGAAHDRGIVHRDVKPENVFVCTSGAVKILDFGLAQMKSAATEETRVGVTIGTPAFMPPEQALGTNDEVDARSDVWGFGATLFTMLSGAYVHDAETLHEQLLANGTKPPRSVREVAPHLSLDVAAVIDRALLLSKSDRWQSAGDMQRALLAARGLATGPDEWDAQTVSLAAPDVEQASRASGPRTAPLELRPPVSSQPTLRFVPQPRPPHLAALPPQPAFAPPTERVVTTDPRLGAEPERLRRMLDGAYRRPLDRPSPVEDAVTGAGPQQSIRGGRGMLGPSARGSGALLPEGVSPPSTRLAPEPPPPQAAPFASTSPAPRDGPAARLVVAVSVLLITLSAGVAAWVLLHR
jgi:serine/threonine-protein kinase